MADAQADTRVVIVVLDGMRPDMITASDTPNLHLLQGRGTRFSGARTVFPSLTRVVSGSIATGAAPSVHGMVSNAFFDPRYDPNRIFIPGSEEEILAYEERVGEPLVLAPTFADTLAKNGRSFAIVHTGSACAAYVLNPNYRANGQWKLSLANARAGTPSPAFEEVRARFGDIPAPQMPNQAVARYAADVFVQHVLATLQPDVAALWLNEPDTTWHYHGLTSEKGLAALKAADAALGKVIDWIESRPDRTRYKLVVMSDHGHCQTPEMIDLYGALTDAGFSCRHSADGDLHDDMLAVTGWTVGSVWARNGNTRDLPAVAEWLAGQSYAGPLFTASGAPHSPYALPLSLTGAEHSRQAPILFPAVIDDKATQDGLPGVGPVFAGRDGTTFTMHGGLSKAELHNLMMIVGDEFEPGCLDDRVCGVLDIAPTVLNWFGIPPEPTMQGHPLQHGATEAVHTTHEVRRSGYHVRLHTARRGHATYIQQAERLA